jgi:hypothetical protein
VPSELLKARPLSEATPSPIQMPWLDLRLALAQVKI